MDREGKHRTEDETMKDDTEGIGLEIDGMELLPESPQPLGGSSSPKNPSQRWIDGSDVAGLAWPESPGLGLA